MSEINYITSNKITVDTVADVPVNDPKSFVFSKFESSNFGLDSSESNAYLHPNQNDASSISELNTPVLGTFSGIFATLDTTSANKRFYSADFWKKVIGSNTVREDLDRGSMIGIFEHPTVRDIYDRSGRPTARHPQNGAFVVKDLQISGNHVIGEAYLLNTYLGKILSTYFLAKDKFGKPLIQLYVSARGASRRSYINRDGIDVMNPNDYWLQTFDVVMNPGFKDARVQMNSVVESDTSDKLESVDPNSIDLLDKLESDTTNYINTYNQVRDSLINDLGLKSFR